MPSKNAASRSELSDKFITIVTAKTTMIMITIIIRRIKIKPNRNESSN